MAVEYKACSSGLPIHSAKSGTIVNGVSASLPFNSLRHKALTTADGRVADGRVYNAELLDLCSMLLSMPISNSNSTRCPRNDCNVDSDGSTVDGRVRCSTIGAVLYAIVLSWGFFRCCFFRCWFFRHRLLCCCASWPF